MRASLALVCAALAFACRGEEREHAPVSAPAALAAADAEGRLDPTPYRAQIEAAQALLYDGDELSQERWKALSAALLELHNAIVFRDSSASARDASGRLFLFSARADAATLGLYGDVELANLRILWRQLCAEKFAPADWIPTDSPPR